MNDYDDDDDDDDDDDELDYIEYMTHPDRMFKTCTSCNGEDFVEGKCSHCGNKQFETDLEYLQKLDWLCHFVIKAACHENFSLFTRDGEKTILQRAVTELARDLKIYHHDDDGCLEHHENTGSFEQSESASFSDSEIDED